MRRLNRKLKLIERIFQDVFKREMTPEERRILLPKRRKRRKRS